jgi:hypothetical protein
MKSKVQLKVLTNDELNKLPPIPETALAAFRSAHKSHNTVLSEMLKGLRLAVKAQIGDNDKWLTLSPKSQEQVLTRIFTAVKDLMKVGSPDGNGVPSSTFNTYCTITKRCMLFHVTVEDAKRHANYALADALQKALKKTGGTIEQRITKTLEECRADPGWIGNPKPLPVPENAEQTAIRPTTIEMPDPRLASSPRHLVKLGVQQFLEWAKKPEVREALRTEGDSQIKEIRNLVGELRDVYDSMSDESLIEAA